MAYSAFNNTIFLSSAANTACNKIIEKLQLLYTAPSVNTDVALTGCAADYFQYATDNRYIRNISFITSSIEIYAYLARNIGAIINVTRSVAYEDRIQITIPEGIRIEIWKADAALAVIDYYGISMQTRATIPANLKFYCNAGIFTGDEAPLFLDADQIFNGGGSTLFQQGWVFGSNFVDVSWTQGTAVPNDLSIFSKIRNYETTSRFSGFSDFEVDVVSNRGQGNGLLADFFAASLNGNINYVLAGNPLKLPVIIEFTNFDVLDAGIYNSTIDFKVTGISARSGTRGSVETISLPIKLTVIGQNDEYTDPLRLDYVHTIGEALPAKQNVLVSAQASYTVTCSKIFNITAPGITDESTQNYTIKRATGVNTFSIGLNSSVEDRGEGFQNHAISIKIGTKTLIVPVSISVAGTDEIRVSPSAFEFEATIGVEEAAAQEIKIVSPNVYTYEYPDWLTITGDLGNTFTGSVDPADSPNFTPGIYQGEIKLESVTGVVIIPIKYTVNANSFTKLLSNKINFTKDQLSVSMATQNTGVYLRAIFNLTWYSFTDVEMVNSYHQHIPIFQGKAEFFPGDFIHNIMDSLQDIEQFIPTDLASRVEIPFDYYAPSNLSMSLEERYYADDSIVETNELNDILFVKGTKPNQFTNDAGIMLSDYPVRVTPKSYGVINFIKRSGIHNIEVHVNGVKKRSIVHDTVTDSVFGMIFSFAEYRPGDLVFLKIQNEDGDFYERRFYVFPQNKESYHLAWVTEHEQLELLEFTGAYSIDSTYERIENNVYRNLVNVKEILQTDKTQPLTTNTGWLLKDNHVLMDSLMRAKKAWLFLPNTDYKIALVPQSKKLANYDSDQALYSYDVEFLINPDNDAKVYPR